MFEDLKSLYITDFSEVCKKPKPLAAPMAIFNLISQDSGSGPAKQHNIHSLT